jgi:hypothetical protein
MSIEAPVLITDIQIRVAANGFIAVYNSKEYVFLTSAALNAWITATSVAG